MTRSQANKTMNDVGCKETVFKILDMLNGESFNDSKAILDVVGFFVKENAFVDAELAKETIIASENVAEG